MRNRYLSFGYQIKQGELVVCPTESKVVEETFARYAAGETLQEIAHYLTATKVEYLPGRYTWDKTRVKRLLDNRRYLGEDNHPPIISEEQFNSVQKRKETAAPKPQKADDAIKLFKACAVCAECGYSLFRRVDNRQKIPIAWKCPCCGLSIRFSDADLKARILAILNRLISTPALVEVEESDTPIDSLEARRSEQELHRMMDTGTFSEDDTLNMVLRCAAKTYESISSARHISDRLTAALRAATLRHAEPLSALDEKLFLQTVENILIDRSGTISLKLQNGKIISE